MSWFLEVKTSAALYLLECNKTKFTIQCTRTHLFFYCFDLCVCVQWIWLKSFMDLASLLLVFSYVRNIYNKFKGAFTNWMTSWILYFYHIICMYGINTRICARHLSFSCSNRTKLFSSSKHQIQKKYFHLTLRICCCETTVIQTPKCILGDISGGNLKLIDLDLWRIVASFYSQYVLKQFG